MTLALPRLHSNGTSAATLLDENMDALGAARALLRALDNAAPNGRDYYHSQEWMKLAIEQHRARCSAVQKIVSELELLCEHIADAA